MYYVPGTPRNSRNSKSASSADVAVNKTHASRKEPAIASTAKDRQPLDAFQEISPAGEGVFMATVRETLTGCCAGCAVPAGLFKAMQVAAGLTLPRDISIHISKADQ